MSILLILVSESYDPIYTARPYLNSHTGRLDKDEALGATVDDALASDTRDALGVGDDGAVDALELVREGELTAAAYESAGVRRVDTITEGR